MSKISGSCLDDSKCRSQFFHCENVPVLEMMECHPEVSLVIRLLSVIASGVHHSL